MFGIGRLSSQKSSAVSAEQSQANRPGPARPLIVQHGVQRPPSQQEPPAQLYEPRKLNEVSFLDMYLSKDPFAPIMARGMRGKGKVNGLLTKGLRAIPDSLTEDATSLLAVIERRWRSDSFKREFRVIYDGHPYRCALIAPPEINPVLEAAREGSIVQRWCVRQISNQIPTFSELGLSPLVQRDIADLLWERGLVIIAGQFASGKTTLASSMMDYWVAESRDVGVAFEDPPEYPMARETHDRGVIYQIDLMDGSIRDAIKHARRWSPRYVMLSEVRSADVTAEMLHIAISSPLVVCTIHSADPVTAIMSLARFAAGAMSEEMARDLISSCLKQVFFQEFVGGANQIKSVQIHGPDNHLIRSKIKTGNFRGLHEDFDRQAINRGS